MKPIPERAGLCYPWALTALTRLVAERPERMASIWLVLGHDDEADASHAWVEYAEGDERQVMDLTISDKPMGIEQHRAMGLGPRCEYPANVLLARLMLLWGAFYRDQQDGEEEPSR